MSNFPRPSLPGLTKRTVCSISLISLLVLGAQTVSAQEYKKITRLGTSQSMCAGGVETLEQLQEYVRNNPEAFANVVANSGSSVSAQAVADAVLAGNVTETSFPVGTKMAWSGAKVKGQYVAHPYREWAGKQSFAGFAVNVSTDCQVYSLAIPKACCNLSLLSVAEDTSEQCAEPVVAAVEEVAPVAPKLGWVPFVGAFAGTETRPRYETAWDMDMRDSSGIKGIRAGIMKELSEKTSAFTQISYYDRDGINGGNIYPEDNLAIDIGLERRLSSSAFIGGGLGIWNIDDSDYRDASVFGHVGGDIGATNFQWILEARFFDSDSDHLDTISSNRMFSAGARYLIK